MGCFRTEADVALLAALSPVAIAVYTALLPQYAFISWAAGSLYYYVTTQLLSPLCEWRKYYYAVFAASGVASIAIYIYALNKAANYAASGDRVICGHVLSPGGYAIWMTIQSLSIFSTALLASIAQIFALKNLLPSGGYPQLPRSTSRLGRFIEMLSTMDDVCTANAPHDGMQRLICRFDGLKEVDDLPSYALIIAAYYAMFHRRDLNLAENPLRVLKSRKLPFDEESAVNVLEAAYKAMATCDAKAVCRVAAVGWSALFKELVALHFVYDVKAAKRLKCKTVKEFGQYEVYTRGVGWHIEYVPDPRLYFIFHAVDRVKPLQVCQPRLS